MRHDWIPWALRQSEGSTAAKVMSFSVGLEVWAQILYLYSMYKYRYVFIPNDIVIYI